IKREAPDMKVALGAFFAFEFMPEDARDRVAELIALKGEHETAGKLAGLNAARSYFAALGSPASVILAGLHQWGTYAGSRATRDTKNLLFTRFFSRTTVQYFSEVMDALPEDVAPDVVSFHVYPADFATRLSFDDINDTIDELADNLNRVAYEKRRGVYPPPMCTGDYCSLAGPSIMITEMGNINPYINEQELAYRLYFTTEHLASYLGLVDSWFWYKPVGHDAQFQLLEGQTGIAPPHTRLVSDPAYVLPPFPGKVPCSALNYMGHLYYYLANDAFCEN
ncbi:MAG TPA: hypothetical protein VM686_23215, partial [Polyangiaceae bacterium]|nr:hypothetical protein [Polyangiaceae bacterium]